MKRGTCATCTFFHEEARPQECRYNPPTIIFSGDTFISKWPEVDSDDWCAHWISALKDGRRKTYNHMINDGDVTFIQSSTEEQIK